MLHRLRDILSRTCFDVVAPPTPGSWISQAIKRPGDLTAKAAAQGGLTKSGRISIRWAKSVAKNPATDQLTRRQANFFLHILHPIHVRRLAGK